MTHHLKESDMGVKNLIIVSIQNSLLSNSESVCELKYVDWFGAEFGFRKEIDNRKKG